MSAVVLVCFPGVFKSAFYHELSGMVLTLINVKTLGEDNTQLVKTIEENSEIADFIIVNYDKMLIETLTQRFKVIMIVPENISKDDWFSRPYFEHLDKLEGLNFLDYKDNYVKLVWEANCLEIEDMKKIVIKQNSKFLKDRQIREVVKKWKKN